MLCGYPLNEKDKEMLFRVASPRNKILLNPRIQFFMCAFRQIWQKKSGSFVANRFLSNKPKPKRIMKRFFTLSLQDWSSPELLCKSKPVNLICKHSNYFFL
jgi:hypothetical protein